MTKPWGDNPKTFSVTPQSDGTRSLANPGGGSGGGSSTSGGTAALSWSAPQGFGYDKPLVIETDGTHDFGTGPQYWWFEDFNGLSVGSYPNGTKTGGMTVEQTREDKPPLVASDADLLETPVSGDRAHNTRDSSGGTNTLSVFVEDQNRGNGKALITEWFISYTRRMVDDLRPSDGAPYLPNGKAYWLTLGSNFGGGSGETVDGGNDSVVFAESGGFEGGSNLTFFGNNSPGDGTGSPGQWNFGVWNTDSAYVKLFNTNDRPNHSQLVWNARTAVSDYRRLGSRGEEQTSETILKNVAGTPYDSNTTYNIGDVAWDIGPNATSGGNWASLIDNNQNAPSAAESDWDFIERAYPIGQPAAWDDFRVGAFWQDTNTGTEVSEILMDLHYIAAGENAFSRVMLTDHRKFDVARKEAVCEPVSWANNKIEVKMKKGLLEAIEGAAVQVALPDLSFLNFRLSGPPVDQGNLVFVQSEITTNESSYITVTNGNLVLVSFAVEAGSGNASEIQSATLGGNAMTRLGRVARSTDNEASTEVWKVEGIASGEHQLDAVLNKNDTEAALLASFAEFPNASGISASPIGTFSNSISGSSVWSFDATTQQENSIVFVAIGNRFKNQPFDFSAGIVNEIVAVDGGGSQLEGASHATGKTGQIASGVHTLQFENTKGPTVASALALEVFV